MKVKEFMHQNPSCCTPQNTLQAAAQMMIECNCGALPVVENEQSMKLLGIITDRDIVCRAVAKGWSPNEANVNACFSTPAITVSPEDSLKTCVKLMEENQVRRIPVVDQNGTCCGLVTQAQIARNASGRLTAELIREVSKETKEPSTVELVR